MKIMKKKIALVVCLLTLAGMVLGAVSTNFDLVAYIMSAGGGEKMESNSNSMISTVGETISGNMESSSYSLESGFVAATASGEQAAGNLKRAYVYPNPVKPGAGGDYGADKITFDELTANVTIDIYNIAGELVRTIDKDSAKPDVEWDLTNDAGQKLASGVYIYRLEDKGNGDVKSGKFSIIK